MAGRQVAPTFCFILAKSRLRFGFVLVGWHCNAVAETLNIAMIAACWTATCSANKKALCPLCRNWSFSLRNYLPGSRERYRCILCRSTSIPAGARGRAYSILITHSRLILKFKSIISSLVITYSFALLRNPECVGFAQTAQSTVHMSAFCRVLDCITELA